MTANASSSSATGRLDVDLASAGLLPPIPQALVAGRDLDLLEPLRFLPPGGVPSGPPPQVDRSALAEALVSPNASYGHPRASELAARLADPRTRVVVTGQQPGLFGGPLLTLTKMAAASRWAEALAARGEPAVAVFWVATEDHDWAEVSTASFLSRDGAERSDLGPDPAPLLPTGMRALGPQLSDTLARLRDAQASPEARQRLAVLERWYRPEARFGEAFCRLMVHLLGERTPLLLDAMLPALKEAQRPWLARLVERRQDAEGAFAAADRRIAARGYRLQVEPQRGLAPLFLLHDGERRRIAWEGDDRYSLRGLDRPPAPVGELLETIADNPSAVSPGVLARPLVQDAVLGSTLQLLGPSEMSYMAQVSPLYRLFDVPAPWTTLRPQALLLAEREAGYLAEVDASLAELLATSAERLLADKKGEDFVAPVRGQARQLVDALHQPIVALDPSLERPWEKTREQIDRALEQLGAKVASAGARRHSVWLRRLERLAATCRPAGELQERSLSVAHFLALYGDGFAAAMAAALDLDGSRLQVITL